MARARLHAFFQLLPRCANAVLGMTAPFRVTLTKPNGFSGAPYLSLITPEWETLYPGTAILLSALSPLRGVSHQDWARLTVCILWTKVDASWDWDSSANGLTWVYMVVPISYDGLSPSGYHGHDAHNTCNFWV